MDALAGKSLSGLVLQSVYPVSYCIISSALFFVCIRLPYCHRLLIVPALIGAAILSLLHSWRLAWLNGADNLWALLMCGWILHSISTLCIENKRPQDVCPAPQPRLSPIYASYKLYNDPRGVGEPKVPVYQFRDTSTEPPASSRTAFCIRRIAKTGLLLGIQVWMVGPCIAASFDFTASDFEPKHEGLIRRVLFEGSWSQPSASSVTSREIRIRAFMAVNWIWIAYLMLEMCHCMFAVLSVGILRLDAAETWPPLFGSPLEAWTVRRFWARFWHRLSVRSSVTIGKAITSRFLCLQQEEWHPKLFTCAMAFWVFLVSGLCHALADWINGSPLPRAMLSVWFVINSPELEKETRVG
jgi:hypothetical protein